MQKSGSVFSSEEFKKLKPVRVSKKEIKTYGKIKSTWVTKKINPDCNLTRIDVKSLSVNDCWRGMRFKTPDYKNYEKALMESLPHIPIPTGKLEIHFIFGFSSKSSDWDNPVKPLQDILQKRYKFNDKLIKRAIVDVTDVKKGEEFIIFEIKPLNK
jgi:Holliday junction resolvase RusA-like endonuclease